MKHLKLSTALLAVALATGPTLAHAKGVVKPDAGFVKNASIGGMFEVESSKVALEKSSRDDVKEFAQRMVDDHGKANDELKATATAEKLGSALAKKLDAKHQAILDKLNAAGDDFDTQYIKAQTDAHNEAITVFEKETTIGKDAALKDFAKTTLPTLQDHKAHVLKLKAS